MNLNSVKWPYLESLSFKFGSVNRVISYYALQVLKTLKIIVLPAVYDFLKILLKEHQIQTVGYTIEGAADPWY